MRAWMRRSASVVVIGWLSFASLGATPCRPRISRAAVGRLRPVVTLLADVQRSWTGGDDSAARDSLLEDCYGTLFDDGSRTGDEVLALIAPFYAGAANGEDLESEITKRGDRMLPLLRRYRDCPPRPGQEPFPSSLETVPDVYDDLIDAITHRGTEDDE